MAPYSGPTVSAPYSAASDPAMAPYSGAPSPAVSPASPEPPSATPIPLGPVVDRNKPFDRTGSLERMLKGLAVPPPPEVTLGPAPDPFNPNSGTVKHRGSPILPPDNPLGLPPAMLPGQSPEGGQWDPAMQDLLYQLLGQANSGGGYQPLGSLGGSYKLASAPPKPGAPQPAGPQIKSFDHGDYRFSDPEATKLLSNPATPQPEKNWAYDRAAADYFQRWGAGSHNQAADYFSPMYPEPAAGQQIAERVRQLSNDQMRQQHRGDQRHHTPVDSYVDLWNSGQGFLGKAKSLALASHPLMAAKSLGDTALGGWRDWTGAANQELQDQLIPQQPFYGSMANLTPEQRKVTLAKGFDDVANRQKDIDAWNHRWMGDQEDMGASISNLYGGFFEQGAPTPAVPGKPDPLTNPWSNYLAGADSGWDKNLRRATMFSQIPLLHAAATSPFVQKHLLGDGQMTAQMAARAGGDAMDAFRQFGQGNWREGVEETRNAATSGILARLNGQLLSPGKELLSRVPFYAWVGTDAFQPNQSRGAAIDAGIYEGGQPGTAGAASPGWWSDLSAGAGNYLRAFQQPDAGAAPSMFEEARANLAALTGFGPSVLGGNKTQTAPVPEKIQAQIAPTAGEAVGGMPAISEAITNATGEEPGSPGWVQILTLLLPFLAPMFARMGLGGGQDQTSLAGSSTANSYYGPEMYGGTA